MRRKPRVAGQFYTASPDLLKKEISDFTKGGRGDIDAIGVVSPHAGYMYSGEVAGNALSSIKKKSTYIILGTNHTGLGKPFELDSHSAWITPLGEVAVNQELSKLILEKSSHIKKEATSHVYEHSIEVQLPFLQYLSKDFSFVPITIAPSEIGIYQEIGRELAGAIKDFGGEVTIIASSDMTHYEPQEDAVKKDKMAIDKILNLDIDGFLKTIEKYEITACGFAPIAVMMSASVELGAKKAALVKYQTSGDASGDYSTVVGYAGIAVY